MKHKIFILLSIIIILFTCITCLGIYKFLLHGRFLPEEVAFSLSEGEFTKIASDCLADKNVELNCYSSNPEDPGSPYLLEYKLFALKYGISAIYKPNKFCEGCVSFIFYKSDLSNKSPTIELIYNHNEKDHLQFMNCEKSRQIKENWIYIEKPFGCGG